MKHTAHMISSFFTIAVSVHHMPRGIDTFVCLLMLFHLIMMQPECVAGGSVDVNLLLRQLLAKGLIGQTDALQSTSQPAATETSSAVPADAAATDVSEVCVHHFDETQTLRNRL